MSVFVVRAGRPTGTSHWHFTLFDDAMISMTYARTLVRSGELVWFEGSPRVQGITNPLWTLVMAVPHSVGVEGSGAALAVSLLGVAIVTATGLIAARTAWRVLQGTRWALLVSAVCGGTVPFLYPLVFWTLRGMEVGLLALLTLALLGLVLVGGPDGWLSGSRWRLPLMVALASMGILTRLDFLLVAAVIFALNVLWTPAPKRLKAGLLTLVPVGAVALGTLVGQRLYYGDWLPNTYYLKVSGFGIGERLARGVETAALGGILSVAVVVACVPVVMWATRETKARRTVVAVAVLVATTLAYSVWVGGDAWEESGIVNRYITVSLPAVVLAIFVSLGSLMNRLVPVPVQEVEGTHARAGLSFRSKEALLWISTGLVVAVVAGLVANGPWLGPRAEWLRVLIPLGMWALSVWLIRRKAKEWRETILASASVGLTALVFVTWVGVTPVWQWVLNGGYYVAQDRATTEIGLTINTVTSDRAVVATVLAGAPGYYADRPMVDLLGKSDRVIARGEPNQDPQTGEPYPFHPGHNKWDYAYSIGSFRPDLVALYRPSDADVANLSRWGYVQRCLRPEDPWWAREGSRNLQWAALAKCEQ